VNTPNIDSLIASGSYTYDSCTVTPANTISAIPAIFTGAPQEVHQLYEWTGTMQAESIVEVFEESGYNCAIVGESENLGGYAATYSTGFINKSNFDEYYFDIAVDWLVEYEPFFMFIYNPMPDRAGHLYGCARVVQLLHRLLKGLIDWRIYGIIGNREASVRMLQPLVYSFISHLLTLRLHTVN
jgi:predicted AlkP superfamily pyrophosphatase or phosphodiesterase